MCSIALLPVNTYMCYIAASVTNVQPRALMKISENVGGFLGGCFFVLLISFMLSGLVGTLAYLGLCALLLIADVIARKFGLTKTSNVTFIYSQPNWTKEWQQILAVEVPPVTLSLTVRDLKKGRLALPLHFDLLRQRYRTLAERAIEEGQKPQQMVEYFLGVKVIPLMQDLPHEIASSIIRSEAFDYVMSERDEQREATGITDQHSLRLLHDGTSLEQILRLLKAQLS